MRKVKTNNLNYSIDPAFNKVKRLFVFHLKMDRTERLF